ncbi:hypothetical protein M8J76_008056 [Diaphorina citri]|nr:hypothetical protein M8J76_008056 [Diaphorina citri]
MIDGVQTKRLIIESFNQYSTEMEDQLERKTKSISGDQAQLELQMEETDEILTPDDRRRSVAFALLRR